MTARQRSQAVLVREPTGTLTFLLTDIERSTESWDLHPAAMQRALQIHDDIFDRCAAQHEGRVVELGREGDSVMCVFARPSQAVACALAAQQQLQNTDWPPAIRPRVRIAIHTGEAELRDGHYFGPALYRCARLVAIAHGGQTILSAPTRDLIVDTLSSSVSLIDLGVHRLKGLSRPERVYQLVHPELESRFPRLRSLDSRRTNLPAELTSFLGREAQLRELKDALALHRMVTITGPGGMGKTRTALHLAAGLLEDFPDGVWFIGLDAVADPALVAQEIANTLAVREVAGTDLLETLCLHLQSLECLLILDNCEHLVEQCAVVSDAIVTRCPDVKVLATSRQATGAANELVLRLDPLSVGPPQSEAARLFIDRAWPNRPLNEVDAPRSEAIAQICKRLDGIPLAIELAAARARVMTVDDLLARLDDRLKILAGGPRTVPRHQTMRAAVDWSYQLLDAKERTLFRRLSVFSGGFTVPEVEEICTGDGIERADVIDLMSQLLEKSLVMPVEVGNQESPMRVLATLQQYSFERLQEAGEADVYSHRHAEYFLRLAEQARDLQNSPEHLGRMDLLEREHDNLRAALASSQSISAERNLRLATALLGFWDERGHLTEGRDSLGKALAAWPDESAMRADALGAAGWLAQRQGDFDAATAYFEESVRIAANVSARPVKARSLRNLALIFVVQGDGERARPLVEEALQIADDIQDRAGTAGAMLVMALIAYFMRDLEAAKSHGEKSLALHRELGDEKVAAFLLACLATLAVDMGELEQARANLRESLEISQRLREKVDVALVLESCARFATAISEPGQAIKLAAPAASIRRVAGAPSAPLWDLLVETALGPAREAVGSSVVSAASKEGAALTLDAALEQALDWLDSGRHGAEAPAVEVGQAAVPAHSALTRRELEIAAMVGSGMRNREIAKKLFLSTRTVDAHVEHIRNKLDFRSRSQIAAWAAAHGLVRD